MDLKLVLAALGLPEGATADDITNFAVAAEKTKVAYGKVLALLALVAGTADAEVCAKLDQLKAANDSMSKLLGVLNVKSADEALGMAAALQANNASVDREGFTKVLAALGATTTDEAVGAVAALKAAKDQLVEVQAKLANKDKSDEETEKASIIEKLKADRKVMPSQMAYVTSMNLESLKAYAKYAVSHGAPDGFEQPADGHGLYKGKKYADLSNMEKHELSTSNPTLFAQLRDAAEAQ
jgi:hypothetical protein